MLLLNTVVNCFIRTSKIYETFLPPVFPSLDKKKCGFGTPLSMDSVHRQWVAQNYNYGHSVPTNGLSKIILNLKFHHYYKPANGNLQCPVKRHLSHKILIYFPFGQVCDRIGDLTRQTPLLVIQKHKAFQTEIKLFTNSALSHMC